MQRPLAVSSLLRHFQYAGLGLAAGLRFHPRLCVCLGFGPRLLSFLGSRLVSGPPEVQSLGLSFLLLKLPQRTSCMEVKPGAYSVPRGCRCLCTFPVSGAALGELQTPYTCLPVPSPVLASSTDHSRASRLAALPPDWVGPTPDSWPFSHLLKDPPAWQLPSCPCRRPPHRGRTGSP